MRAIVVWAVIAAALAAAGGAAFGPLGAIVSLSAAAVYLLAFATLPRAAHRAFGRGDFARASRLFRVAGVIRLVPSARRAARLSVCACELGDGRWQDGLAKIEQLDSTAMERAERAVWNNNMAYALARLGQRHDDAIRFAGEALGERPGLAGFVHTKGIALLAAGRTDDAIAALEAVYAEERTSDTLEAERCYDLGRAWAENAEADYACDYFSRATRAAPSSRWAKLAAVELAERNMTPIRPPTEGLL